MKTTNALSTKVGVFEGCSDIQPACHFDEQQKTAFSMVMGAKLGLT
jgi:hypothetical protein